MPANLPFELPLHRAQIWRRAIVLIALFVALALLVGSDPLHEAFMTVLDASESIIASHPLLGACLFIAAAAISAMLAFVSVAAIVPVALVTWGGFFTVVLLWLGWTLGGLLAYGIGRWLGRGVVAWLTSNSLLLRRLEKRIGHDTPFVLVLLFQLALPSELPGYVLGIAKYSLPRYLLSLGIAELPYTLATVYLGESFVERKGIALLIAGVALALFSIATFYVLRKRLAQSK